MEQKCVRRSWRNHGRSPGPHTVPPSARVPRGAGPDHSAGEGWLLPTPPFAHCIPPEVPMEQLLGSPPRKGKQPGLKHC